MNKEHGLLNEKYRPTKLENFVGNKYLKKQISSSLNNKNIQNYLFYGPAGSGKTTLARLIAKNLDCDYIYINASDENGIDTIRDKVKTFASSATFKPLKIIILDEADYITIQGQSALRNVIETFSQNTRFILTGNFIERIIDPIQSRCQTIKVTPPSRAEIAKHLDYILGEENISYQDKDLVLLVNKLYPDLRKCLNSIQANTIEEKGLKFLKLDKSFLINSNYIDNIIEELKSDKPKIREIHKIIIQSGVKDFEGLHRQLYERAEEYSPNNLGSIAILINEHNYKLNFRIDKEINTLSLISQIINLDK